MAVVDILVSMSFVQTIQEWQEFRYLNIHNKQLLYIMIHHLTRVRTVRF